MPAGRPRTISFSPKEMEALGKEMLEWITINQPIHLSQWYTIHKHFTYNEWKSFLQLKEFLPYYEVALKMVGMKYLDGTVDKSISQRFLRVYFKDLKEEENETLEFQSKLKSQEVTALTDEMVARHEAMMDQISSLQSARKIADKSKSKDQ